MSNYFHNIIKIYANDSSIQKFAKNFLGAGQLKLENIQAVLNFDLREPFPIPQKMPKKFQKQITLTSPEAALDDHQYPDWYRCNYTNYHLSFFGAAEPIINLDHLILTNNGNDQKILLIAFDTIAAPLTAKFLQRIKTKYRLAKIEYYFYDPINWTAGSKKIIKQKPKNKEIKLNPEIILKKLGYQDFRSHHLIELFNDIDNEALIKIIPEIIDTKIK